MTKRMTPGPRGATTLIAFAAGAVAALVSCASPPDADRKTAVGLVEPLTPGGAPELNPSYTQFKDYFVSEFLTRRCGTLDCHGQPGRPLRIYGQRGLRLPNQNGLRPVTGDTSEEEVAANYRAAVGLEPEVMNRVVAARAEDTCSLKGEPETPCLHHLLLVAKPLSCNKLSSHGCGGGERGVEHKGGPVIAFGDDGYNCLKTWVQGITDPGACQRAANAY